MRLRTGAGLRARLTTLIVVSLVPAVALTVLESLRERGADEQHARDEASRIVRQVSYQYDTLVESARQMLLTLSLSPEVLGNDAQRCGALLRFLQNSSPLYANLVVVEPDGSLFASAIPTSGPTTFSDRDWFKLATQTRKFTIGGFVIGRIAGVPVFSAALPILDSRGTIRRIITVALDLGWLNEIATRIDLPPGSAFTAFDGSGTVLVRVPTQEGAVGKGFAEVPLVRELLTHPQGGTGLLKGIDGVPRFYAFRAISDSSAAGAFVSVGFSADHVYAQSRTILTESLLGLVVLILLAALATWIVSELSILRPVDALLHAAGQIERGATSARVERGRGGGGEVGRLADAFNRMAISLEDRERGLRESEEKVVLLNRELEGRVTERTAQLARSEAWNRAVIDTAADGLITVDSRGRVETYNPSARRLFGWPEEEIVGCDVRMLLPMERRTVEAGLTLQSSDDLGLLAGEETGLRKDGTTFIFEFVRRGFQIDSDAHTVISIHDVTERKRWYDEVQNAKAAAERANSTKSEFLANMSHEIRTPMNAVLGFAALALKRDLSPRVRDYLNKIHTAGGVLLGVINDILDFSKIEAGRLDMEDIAFDVGEVLNGVISTTGHAARAKGLEFLLFVPPSVPRTLRGDPNRLGQVLINLVGNSVKFTERGEVELAVTRLKKEDGRTKLRFTVRDTGIGMDSEQVGRLFTPFTQADNSTTRHYGGTGLGLSIARRLVEMMGGQIWVETAPGEGSRFIFTAWFGQGTGEAAQREAPSHVRGNRVLLAEANPAVRASLREVLESLEFRVEIVTTADDAIEAVDRAAPRDPFSVILLDSRMPGKDWAEVTRRITHRRSGLRSPATIVLSAAVDEEAEREKALGAGAAAVLTKPVTPSSLIDAVVAAISPNLDLSKSTDSGTVATAEGLRGAHVLLAEDNQINQQIAVELLHSMGAEVTVVGNGAEALDALERNAGQFHMVLMDIQMPGMDGYETARRIRSQERLSHLPVIAMTANTLSEERDRAAEAGMNDHIGKPIDPNVMIDVLSRYYHAGASPSMPAVNSQQFPELSLQGIDVADGLRRVAGNRALYEDLLERFRGAQARTAEEVREAVARGDTEGAIRLAHTLKGVAGNIGALQVHHDAANVESMLRRGQVGQALQAPLEALEKSLCRVVLAVDARAASPTEPVKPPGGDPSRAPEALEKLRRLSDENDSELPGCLTEVRADIAARFGEESVRSLEQSARSYDFAAVLAVIQAMQARLAQPE